MSLLYSVNTTRGAGTIALFRLKQLMKSAGWTVPRSGDGLTYFPSSDGITSGNSGAGGLQNTNAWFVIQMPLANSVNRQFMFQMTGYSPGVNGSTSVTIKYSYSAGFTGGSPSATIAPTATDGYTLLNNSALFAGEFAFRMVAAADNVAPYGVYMGSYTVGGANQCQGAFLVDPMISGTFNVADVDPYVFYADGSAGYNLSSVNTKAQCWIKKGLSGEGFMAVTAVPYQTASQNVFPTTLGYNSHTGLEDTAPILWARNSVLGAPSGVKGYSSLARYSANIHTTPDVFSTETTNDGVILGDFIFPFNGGLIQR